MSLWKVYGAKVQGPSHVQTNTPCQDAFYTGVSQDGQWVSMVVSDGAGSAARAEEGSQLVAQVLSEKLLDIAAHLSTRVPGAWINDFVIQQVIHVRELLRQKAGKDDIRDFHCTLVAALVGPSGGFLIHIGDGSVLSGTATPDTTEENILNITINNQSKPENGEYANETFFITEKDWIKHLRISPVGKTDWIMLATDGGCALTLQNESVPHITNLKDIFQHLLKLSEENRSNAIQAWLETDGAKKLSNDDKTLVIGLSSSFGSFGDYDVRLTSTSPEPSKPVVMQPAPAIAPQNAVKQIPQNSHLQQSVSSSTPSSGANQLTNKPSSFNVKKGMIFLTLAVATLFLLSLLQDAFIPASSNVSESKNPPKSLEAEKKVDPSAGKKSKDAKDDRVKEEKVKEEKVKEEKVSGKTGDETPVQNNDVVTTEKKSETDSSAAETTTVSEKSNQATSSKNKDNKKDADKSSKAP